MIGAGRIDIERVDAGSCHERVAIVVFRKSKIVNDYWFTVYGDIKNTRRREVAQEFRFVTGSVHAYVIVGPSHCIINGFNKCAAITTLGTMIFWTATYEGVMFSFASFLVIDSLRNDSAVKVYNILVSCCGVAREANSKAVLRGLEWYPPGGVSGVVAVCAGRLGWTTDD